jgi:hypothetical protein
VLALHFLHLFDKVKVVLNVGGVLFAFLVKFGETEVQKRKQEQVSDMPRLKTLESTQDP